MQDICIYVKNNTCKNYKNDTDTTRGEPLQGKKDVGVSIQVSKFKLIIGGAAYKHPNTTPDCIAYLERMLQTFSNCGKNMYMLFDTNDDLLITRAEAWNIHIV